MKIKIKNLTPHTINFFDASQCKEVKKGNYTSFILKAGEKPVLTIAPVEKVVRATSKIVYTKPNAIDGVPIPQVRVVFSKLEGLPETLDDDNLYLEGLPDTLDPDTLYIVSFATAITYKAQDKDTKQLRLVYDTVRNEHGQVVGALSLAEI